ncbi:uncharacterized protein LOC143899390 [Temnothorax americanus]|uniref:uncharacterized protein LOC143899390 n=1 Tax=Temnothorax americanus TaxID=1964332 RepID=UPI0040676A88
MAEDNVDDILVRLDEIEKLQTELRHLVPRVTSSSSRHARHQDLSRDSPASIRFPSLFTFPVISNFTSTSKNERVQKSAARLNLNSKSLSGNRHSTANLRNAGGSSRSGTRETSVFKNLLKSNNNVTSSHARDSSASTSVADSRVPARSSIVNRVVKYPQEAMKKRLKSDTSKTVPRDKTQRITGERSNVQISGNENVNSSEWISILAFTVRSSVQISDIPVHGTEATQSRDACLRSRDYDRSGTLIERIIEKLNYCFVDNKRVTVPYHHLGNKIPRRVQILHSINGTETPRLHESAAKMSVN